MEKVNCTSSTCMLCVSLAPPFLSLSLSFPSSLPLSPSLFLFQMNSTAYGILVIYRLFYISFFSRLSDFVGRFNWRSQKKPTVKWIALFDNAYVLIYGKQMANANYLNCIAKWKEAMSDSCE